MSKFSAVDGNYGPQLADHNLERATETGNTLKELELFSQTRMYYLVLVREEQRT